MAARLPAVRLPPATPDEAGDGHRTPALELPPSTKFGFAFPAEPPSSAMLPAPTPVPSAINPSEPNALLSSGSDESGRSSDAESVMDVAASMVQAFSSGVGAAAGAGLASGAGAGDVPEELYHVLDDYTPTAESSYEATMRGAVMPPAATPLGPPRLTRAFSMPLSSELRHLQHPRRSITPQLHLTASPAPLSDGEGQLKLEAEPLSPTRASFQELSLEFADSVQMVVQTLLHVSPPQLLDSAKEQYAACQLTVPTPSMTAMLTAMKNLNYMSANMSRLSSPSSSPNHSSRSLSPRTPGDDPPAPQDDFDVGEMLQSVGDALSGVAANAGVEVVLFHGDVGLKHVFMKGDECGVSYVLLHIARQVIAVSRPGDTVEIGLNIIPGTLKPAKDGRSSPSTEDTERAALPSPPPIVTPGIYLDTSWTCTFDVAHKFASPAPEAEPSTDTSPSSQTRPKPQLDGQILRRLLSHIGATLETDLPPKNFSPGWGAEMTVTLPGGTSPPSSPRSLDDGIWQPDPRIRLAQEPTLDELTHFLDTLRGRNVILHSAPEGIFSHHLTSYLTAWGLNVSHVPLDATERERDGGGHSKSTSITTVLEEPGEDRPNSPRKETSNTLPSPGGMGLAIDGFTAQIPQTAPGSFAPTAGGSSSFSSPLIIIDDDVRVLRRRLLQQRADASPLNMRPRKRPPLVSNHRPRSTPHVGRASGLAPPVASSVIVHFTSLANYKLVKDVMQSVVLPVGSTFRLPEVIVILKPAGPRRFLTALHTAITKPVIDPFFTPIATSPSSPTIPHDVSPFASFTRKVRPGGGTRTNSDKSERSNRSPKEHPAHDHALMPPSPLRMSDGMEYFTEAAEAMGTSPSSGLVIQSPDGQPAGIFFHPKKKNTGKSGLGSSEASTHPNAPSPSGGRGAPQYTSFLIPVEPPRTNTSGDDQTSPPNSRRTSGNRTRPSPRLQPVLESMTQDLRNVSPMPPVVDPTTTLPGSRRGSKGASGTWEDSPVSTASEQSARPMSPTSVLGESSRIITSDPGTPGRRGSGVMSPRSSTPGARRTMRRAMDKVSTPPTVMKKGKSSFDTNIVPPISVLIVEDNPINQNVLCMFMKRKKIKYEAANNGQQAVEKWRNGNFHLILMDIQMPVMDGIEATKEIRHLEKLHFGHAFPGTPLTEGRGTPSEASSSVDSRPSSLGGATPFRSSVIIVALTASSLQSDRVAALAAGCNDFLTKPVSLAWLNSKIIEWGSIKALQMWSDLRPEVVKSIVSGQVAQAKSVASKLHVPEGRNTPSKSRSRTASPVRKLPPTEAAASALTPGTPPGTQTPTAPNVAQVPESSAPPTPEESVKVVRSNTISSITTNATTDSELSENALVAEASSSPSPLPMPHVVVRSASDILNSDEGSTPRPTGSTEASVSHTLDKTSVLETAVPESLPANSDSPHTPGPTEPDPSP